MTTPTNSTQADLQTHIQARTEPLLTSLSHGGGCGCKIAPGVLSEILKGTSGMVLPLSLIHI